MLTVEFISPSSDYLFDPLRGDSHTHFQILPVREEEFGSRVVLNTGSDLTTSFDCWEEN